MKFSLITASRVIIPTLFVSIFSTSAKGQAIHISVPGNVPSGASPSVDHAFPSFAFETSSYPLYSGNHSSPNIFSRNLVQVIANKTGKAPVIRVGGTSGDHSQYDPNLSVAVTNPGTLPLNITIGPPFFEGLSNFPSSQYTWQVTLARQCDNCQANAIAATEGALNGMGGAGNLDSLELGNEVDLYPNPNSPNHDRPVSWGPSDYVSEWKELGAAVEADVTGLPSQIFQGLVLSSGNQPPWVASTIFQDGIDSGSNIKSVSQHFYQTTVSPLVNLANTLMNHTAIRTKLDNFKTPISYLLQNHPGIPFVLGEVGSALNPPSRPKFELSDDKLMGVLGSALWTVDFMLYSMTIAVARVNMQQGTRFPYAGWQPADLTESELQPPHVRAPFYGYTFIADFIGNSTQPLRVSNLDLSLENTAAYSGYESGVLQRIAVVNLDVWNSTSSMYPTPHPRPVQDYVLSLPADIKTVTVQYLAGPGASSFADDEWGISWGGYRWTSANGGFGVQVRNDTISMPVNFCSVTVSVNSSAAALVTMNR